MAEIREYVTGFISAVVAFLIAVSVIPLILNAVGQVEGVALLSVTLVGTIIGAGLIMYLLKTFM